MGLPVIFINHSLLEGCDFICCHGGAFGIALGLFNVEQNAPGAFAAHDPCSGPHGGKKKMGFIGPAAHAVIGRSIVGSDDQLNLRHLGTGDRPYHVGAKFSNAGMFRLGPDHVTRGTLDKEQRDFFIGASDHPFGHLFGGFMEDDAGAVGADNPHGKSLDPDFSCEDIGPPSRGKVFLGLYELRSVGNGLDDLIPVESLVGRGGQNLIEGFFGEGFLNRIPVQVERLGTAQGEQFPDPTDGLGLVGAEMVCPAGHLGVNFGASQGFG